MVGVAFVVRLPYLLDVPRFTDELQEVLWALAIVRGEILPMTAVDSYYGPLWSYLIAALFRVVGVSDAVPRLLAAILASVSVGLTYLLGRELVGRWSALVAAGLMLTSGGHIVINSHTARSNSITPMLMLVVVWCVHRAIRTGHGGNLAAAGFVGALALQTHVSALAFAPGLAMAVLLGRPGLLRGRWVAVTIVAGVLGYANMLVYNLQHDFFSVIHARNLQEGYTDGQSTDLSTYAVNLQALVQSLSRLLSGTIDTGTNPLRLLYLALAATGLVMLARRRQPLPLLFCLSAIVILPYFNPRYGPILSGRYLVPLLPLGFMGIAIVIQAFGDRLKGFRSGAYRLATATALAFVLYPLAPLAAYYQEVVGNERTNAPLFILADSTRALYRPGALVLLDEGLAQEQLTAGGTDLKAMRMLLETRAIPYEIAKLGSQQWDEMLDRGGEVIAVMDTKKRSSLGRGLQVASMGAEVESASGTGHRYGVYRLARRLTGAPGALS